MNFGARAWTGAGLTGLCRSEQNPRTEILRLWILDRREGEMTKQIEFYNDKRSNDTLLAAKLALITMSIFFV